MIRKNYFGVLLNAAIFLLPVSALGGENASFLRTVFKLPDGRNPVVTHSWMEELPKGAHFFNGSGEALNSGSLRMKISVLSKNGTLIGEGEIKYYLGGTTCPDCGPNRLTLPLERQVDIPLGTGARRVQLKSQNKIVFDATLIEIVSSGLLGIINGNNYFGIPRLAEFKNRNPVGEAESRKFLAEVSKSFEDCPFFGAESFGCSREGKLIKLVLAESN